MRVFTGSLYTETNTFSPLPCGLAAFRDRGYYPAGKHPDELLFYAGPLWAARQRARERGWVLLEGMVASAQPAGIVTRQAYEALRDELLDDLKSALPVDMVVLALHGAMVADGYDDCEGDVLTRVRQVVGPQVVVGVELDPHCHLSPCMLAQADLVICFKEYPHTDVAERAFELVDLCAEAAAGRVRPVASVADCEMIVTVHTTREPARGFVDRMSAMEQQPGVLSVSLAHGFAWGDTPDMGTKLLVYTDALAAPSPQQAKQRGQVLARQLADELIGMRDQLTVQGPGIDEALDQALSLGRGPVVLADSADNPGGGAAGDSTYLLQRLLARAIGPAAIGPLWDPMAVRFAFEAGVGAQLPLRVGGKTGPLSGEPVDAIWTVQALAHDMTMRSLSGAAIELGHCACVATAGVSVILTTLRNQALATDLFTQLGMRLEDQRIVVVKSSQHFYTAFAPVAAKVIYVSAPGSVPFDLAQLPYRKARRPKWPLLSD
ncbi:MAG: M81 family metallopeptidase [Rubrivivax sp.]|nr:M81 family metallopeptidase [Rubrivivax sp.]